MYDDAVQHYKELLTYIKSAVTRNYSEKSIDNMLNRIEKGSEDVEASQCMEQFYALTLESFQSSNNERLWLKTNLKLARLWLDKQRYTELTRKLRELHKACQREDGTDDPSKGTYSLETYALEIQMYSDTKNNKQLKSLYQRALRVKSAVPHPKIMGVIRECGGKMHLNEESWEAAKTDFNDAFRSYDEAGSMQRITILKYLCLATMLMGSDINPFDSQETQPYKNDPRISAMTDLVDAYQHDEVHRYEATLTKNPDLLQDTFIAENIDEVTRSMRKKAILKLVAPYTRFTLKFVSGELKIPVTEVQDIVAFLVVDKKIDAKMDASTGIVTRELIQDDDRTTALEGWVAALRTLSTSVLNDGEGFKPDDGLLSGPGGFGGGDFDLDTRPRGPRSGKIGSFFGRR